MIIDAKRWSILLGYLHFAGLAILIAALPLSNFFMSFGMFWLAGVWLLQIITDLKNHASLQPRWQRFFSNRNALLLSGLYLLPIIGLLWTSDFSYAGWDLRMKLPLLILPFLLCTLNPISIQYYRALIGIFLLSLTFAVSWCMLIYWHVIPKNYHDVREISVFISHVRFSLLLILGIVLMWFEAWKHPYGKALTILLSSVFIFFLYIMGSMTGLIVLIVVLTYCTILLLKSVSSVRQRWIISAIMISVLLAATWGVRSAYKTYFDVQPIDWSQLNKTTSRGEVYEHNPTYPVIEDGHYIMTHIAWGELYSAWEERSQIHPDSMDARGHVLKGTLIRYLASKGLRKDMDGVAALSETDIKSIEAGIPNSNEKNKSGLHRRLDNIFFELANYRAGGTPNGHSVFQRFEFWRAASCIIREHPWTGVGTGDVKTSFADAYERMGSKLEKPYRLRAHNQYLTMWVTFGIAGLLYFLVMIVAPIVLTKNNRALFIAFMIIAALSFLTEDTLESQAGVMFFCFFFIFLGQKPSSEDATPHQA